MNEVFSLPHPDGSLEFLGSKGVFSLCVKDDHLNLTCLKKLNPLNPRPIVSFNQTFHLKNVISSKVCSSEWRVASKTESLSSANITSLLHSVTAKCHLLKINFGLKTKGHLWKLQYLKLRCISLYHCRNWSEYLNQKLEFYLRQQKCQRPKCLLVFVNPFGGRHKAKQVHQETVTPIFDIANVKQHVIITKCQNHAKEYIENEDISQYDGIIAVGGDGMINEIFNGVVIQAQKQEGIQMDRPGDCTVLPSFVKPGIRIGVIPAGSTNCLSYVTQGIDDAETAALHIVLGDDNPLDLCSIYDRQGKFQRFSCSMTSFGFYGNVLKVSERMRQLGPSRYDVAGIHAFMNLRSYSMEVSYLPTFEHNFGYDSTTDRACQFPCKTCNQKDDDCSSSRANDLSYVESGSQPDLHSESAYTIEVNSNNICSEGFVSNTNSTGDQLSSEGSICNQLNMPAASAKFPETSSWKVVRGKFVMLNSALMSCSCAKCPHGLSPTAHLADGNIDLIMVRDCPRADFIRYMLAHVGKADRFQFPFVEAHRVKAFRCVALPDPPTTVASGDCSPATSADQSQASDAGDSAGCWNTDGELVSDPNISLCVHRGLVRLFARGVEAK